MTYKDIRDYIDNSLIILGRQNGKHDAVFCLNIFRDAIDKQIPKRPLNKKHFTDFLSVGFCPCCGEGTNEEMKFCSECGQKLDWRTGYNENCHR